MPTSDRTASSTFDRVAADLAHQPFPALAAAIRARIDRILKHWRDLSLKAMPHLDAMTRREFENAVSAILSAAADALKSADPGQVLGVFESGSLHGIDRFVHKHSLLDLFEEVRILRGVVIVEIDQEMKRPLEPDEAASFHAIFDIIVQQGVMALTQRNDEAQETALEMNQQLLVTAVRHNEVADQTGATSREMNEQLLVSSIRQHELTEQAQQAQQALRESNSRFEAVFQASPIGMYLVDSELRIRQVSRFAREIFGDIVQERGELIGRDFVEVIHMLWPADVAADIVARFRHCLQTGAPYVAPEFTEERYDRKVREYYDWQLHRIALPDGQYGVVCYFIDISARVLGEQNLRVSEVRYRRLFEAAHDGILIIDPQTAKIVDVNRYLLDMLRFPREYFVGKELWELGLFKDKEQNQEAMLQLQRDGLIRYEDMPLQDRDGRRVPVEFVSNIYQEDHEPVIQCNIRDISERKRFQEEREAHLSSEQLLRMEAEAANRAKDIFLATLSHELRTPLTAILGWAVLLRLKSADEAAVKAASFTIERNAKVQAQLIEDVLDVSRIVSGKLRLELRASELSRIVMDAVASVQTAADAKDIRIGVEVVPGASPLVCDAGRIQQVIWNLLTNAIKFSPKVGDIGVLVERADSMARITVTDHGEGITAEFLPHVFERFRQSDGTSTRMHGGLGLGLSIVRHLVELHGGTVEVQSDGLGHGATFIINLPIRAVVDAPADGTGHGGRAGAGADGSMAPALMRLDGLRVLVVDDEPDARNLIKAAIEHAGAVVAAAQSSAEALRLLTDMRPHVIVSDISMPVQDGYELMKQIRSMGEGYSGRDLPAIALTAYARTEDRRRAMLAGFQIHVAKPIDPHELTEVVASLAGRTGRS